MSWKKLIPGRIKITSLYWVEKEEKCNNDVSLIFHFIDKEAYSTARHLIQATENNWQYALKGAPDDLKMKYYGEIRKAEAMLDFLETPLEK